MKKHYYVEIDKNHIKSWCGLVRNKSHKMIEGAESCKKCLFITLKLKERGQTYHNLKPLK